MNKKKTVTLRTMTEADIPLGMTLKSLANWNQLEADWTMLLHAAGDRAFVAMHKGQGVGTATVIHYDGKFSWVGMVLVNPEIRRFGVGSMLLHGSIDCASQLGPVRLDATPEGKTLYDTLGFVDEYRLTRLQCDHLLTLPKPEAWLPMITVSDMGDIIAYDTPRFGARRQTILEALRNNAPQYAFMAKTPNGIRGYCMGRRGEHFDQIGPIVADNAIIARDLLLHALGQIKQIPVIIDTLDAQDSFAAVTHDLGFTPQRPFTRMCKGDFTDPGNPQEQFAIAGPELG